MFIDLHIHSHYSKGSSIHSNLRYLEEEAKIKGLSIIGTGDFLHSLWFEEIKKYLIENPETGLHKGNLGIKFMLTCEICNYYAFRLLRT
jgi:PHP family Zn ribbon phosphoesterase